MGVDIEWGYNKVLIKPKDRWKAAFITNEGLYEPTVMFFSLTNSPATFQTMMNTIFHDLIDEGSVTIYIDDIAIHTGPRPEENHEDHLKRHQELVQQVLKQLKTPSQRVDLPKERPRSPQIPRLHQILPLLHPRVLANHSPPIRPHKAGDGVALGQQRTTSVQRTMR